MRCALPEGVVNVRVGDDAGAICHELLERDVCTDFRGDGLRISVGEEDSVEKVLWIAASVVKDLPEGHSGRGLA